MLCCLQVAEGITRLHHWQSIIIPVPMLSSAARCFELFAVSSSLLHAHNPGCFLSVFRTVSCLYTTPIKVCVRRTCCMLGTTSPAGGYSARLCKLQNTAVLILIQKVSSDLQLPSLISSHKEPLFASESNSNKCMKHHLSWVQPCCLSSINYNLMKWFFLWSHETKTFHTTEFKQTGLCYNYHQPVQ